MRSDADALMHCRSDARAWLCDQALPYWSEAGLDKTRGGFQERAHFDGSPDTMADKRIRVQGRQIYVMSHAHVLGLSSAASEAADAGYAFLTRQGWHADGGFVHLLTPGGAIANDLRDTYDHAFALLGLGWYARATGSSEARHWIARTVSFVDAALKEPGTDFYFEDSKKSLPRRQNPHMHLLEAFMALYECLGEEQYLARARTIVGLFKKHFFRSGALCEFFANDWTPAPGEEGRLVEPGHHFEWVWLLGEFERLSGEKTQDLRDALYAFAERHGVEPGTGLVYDGVRSDGSLQAASKRCWPQTEVLRARIMRRRDGHRDTDDGIVTATRNLLDRYFATEVPGLWQDQFGPAGEPLTRFVPASTLYHAMGAFVALG